MAPQKNHRIDSQVIIGASRTAKSTGVVEYLMTLAGFVAIIVLDAQRSLGQMFLERLIHKGKTKNLLFDDFAQSKCVLQYDWLRLPPLENTFEFYEAVQKRINRFLTILASFRDGDIGRLIWEWCEAALWLYAYQKTKKTFWHLPYVFDPDHSVHKEWVRDCADETIKNKFANLRLLHPATRIANVSPAGRLCKQIMLNSGFISRTGDDYGFHEFLENKGILICTAGDGADKESTRVMLSSISAKSIEHTEEGRGAVLVVYDECFNFKTVTANGLEVQALNTQQKKGWNGIYIGQQPPEEELWQPISENTEIHKWYRTGSSQTAKAATEDIAYSLIDREKISHHKDQEFSDGHDLTPIGNDGRETYLPRRKVFQVPVFESANEQMHYITQQLVQLKRGERFVKDHGIVYREQLPLPKEIYPWASLAKKATEKGLAKIYQRSEYVTPKIELPNNQSGSNGLKTGQGRRKRGRKNNKKSSKGMKHIPAS